LCTPKLGTGSQHGGYRSTVPEIVIAQVEERIGNRAGLSFRYEGRPNCCTRAPGGHFHSYRYANR